MNKDKDGLIITFCSLGILLGCVALYYHLGLMAIHGFPGKEVLGSLPLALAVWILSTIVDPQKYLNFLTFIGCMIFGSTVFTGIFIMFFTLGK